MPPPLLRSNFSINVPHHLWSAVLPLEVSHLYQSGPPASTFSVNSLHHPPSAPAKGPRRRSRAIDPQRLQFTRGQCCRGSKVRAEWVKWDWMCPPRCQEPWRSARPSSFPDPDRSIAASPTSTELWFIITLFFFKFAHDIPWKIRMHMLLPQIDFGWKSSWPAGGGVVSAEPVLVNREQYTLICCCFQCVLLLFQLYRPSAGSRGAIADLHG